MNLQELVNNANQSITEFAGRIAPGLPPELVRYADAAVLFLLAFILLITALRLLRGGNRHPHRVNVPRTLQQEGAVVDILNSPADEDVAVRCVLTSVSSGKIRCEIIERLDTIKAKEGNTVACVFAPMKAGKGKVNSFTAKLTESDTSGRKVDRLVLSVPKDYTLIPRRKHARKRVADQQFIRVKMWATDPYTSDISFEDAVPHIGVNSFMINGSDQTSNAVVNISHGGIGLLIRDQVIPETCSVGAPVAINLFMFSFKEKSFKPYWYTGEVRSMHEGRPGFTRMGIEFTGSGEFLPDAGAIRWTKFD